MIHHEYSIAGHKIETPLVNAAGSINGTSRELILREVDILANTAIGAITVGSFTVPEQAGNEARCGSPMYYYDKETGASYNSMGLPNVGLVAAKSLMPEIVKKAHAKGKPVIASVASTLESRAIGDSYEQLAALVYEMQSSGVDLIEVSPGSPNTVTTDGGRKPLIAYNLESMHELTEALAPQIGALNRKIGLKLPPYITDEQKLITPDLADLINEKQLFSFITTANTIPDQIALNRDNKPILSVPNGRGGMSGAATKEVGREQLQLWRQLMDSSVDIVSTLGVDSGAELAVRRQLGASAAGGVTFLWESSNWGDAVTKVVSQWAEYEL